MTTYREYLAQIEELKQKAEDARKAELSAVITDIKQKVAEHGLTAADIFGSGAKGAQGRAKSTKVAPKYRGPNGELWTGRGRKPAWVVKIVDAGGSLDAYQIS